jgi:hypothetical protein
MADTGVLRPRLPAAVAARAARAAAPARLTFVAFGGAASVVAFDAPAAPAEGGRARLSAVIDGAGAPRPSLHAALTCARGGRRHVLFLAGEATRLSRRRLSIALDGAPAALHDPGWLRCPLAAPSDLCEGLSADGGARLLRAAAAAAALFGAGRDPDLGAALDALAEALTPPPLEPVERARVGRAALLSFALPRDLRPGPRPTVALLGPGGVGRLETARLRLWSDGGRARLDVAAPHDGGPGAVALLCGASAARLRLDAGAGRLAAAEAWLASRDAAGRAWSRAMAGPEPRDVDRAGEGAPPGGIEILRLSCGPEGALLLARLVGAAAAARAVSVERGGARSSASVTDLRGGTAAAAGDAAAAAGFFGLEGVATGPVRVRALDASGRTVAMAERVPTAATAPLTAAEVPREHGEAAEEAAARAARAYARALGGAPAAAAVARAAAAFGPTPARPTLTLVAAVADDPDVMRLRAALLASEPGGARALTVLVHALDDGAEARVAAARETAAAFGTPVRLLAFDPETPAAARLRAALARVAGPALLTGPAVLPDGAGWLRRWRAALARSAAGAAAGAVASVHGGIRASRPSAAGVGLTEDLAARFAAGPWAALDPEAGLAAALASTGGPVRVRADLRLVDYAPPAPPDPLAEAVRRALVDAARGDAP